MKLPRHLLIFFFFFGSLLLPISAAAQSSSNDPRAEREAVRAQRAAAAGEVDVLQASEDEVQKALDGINANITEQQNLLADAERKVTDAKAREDAAQASIAATEAEIATILTNLNDEIATAFISGSQAESSLLKALDEDPIINTKRQAYENVQADTRLTLVERLEAARVDLQAEKDIATKARADGEAARAEVESRISELTTSQEQQQELSYALQDQIATRLAEVNELAAKDAALTEQIRAEEERLRQLAAQQEAARQAAAAARAAAARNNVTAPPAPGDTTNMPAPNLSVDVTTVSGITVATSISAQVDNLVRAAQNDGVSLGGGGYRSADAQISLRRQNCGSSNYAIYEAPASSCSPPTARPGQSMHERGLAIDFTYNGSGISSHSNPGYQWLAAHAAEYGLYNLPSEPWHWSTTGT